MEWWSDAIELTCWWGEAPVRGQDIGYKYGQDIGYRWHTQNAWFALRRRIVGWSRRRHLNDCFRLALLDSMRTFRIFGLEKGQLVAVIHFMSASPVSDKHWSPH